MEGSYSTYTPTYSSNIGNQAATYSGAITTTTARYKKNQKQLSVTILFSGTLLAVYTW